MTSKKKWLKALNVRTENSQYNYKYKEKIVRIDPVSPDLSIIERAASIIKRGGVVVFPARSMYGLAADALNPNAIERIFDIKKRPSAKPLLVLIPNNYDLSEIVTDIPEKALTIMNKFWPGLITIVLNAKDHLPQRLTAGTGKIGIRMPGNPVAAFLAQYSGCPITGTSANISEMDSCISISDMPKEIIDSVDLVLDAGTLEGGKGSTVIDATTEKIQILREGNISAEELSHFTDIL